MAVIPPKIGKRTPEQILAEMDSKKNAKKSENKKNDNYSVYDGKEKETLPLQSMSEATYEKTTLPTTMVGQDVKKTQQELNYEENVKPDYEYHSMMVQQVEMVNIVTV